MAQSNRKTTLSSTPSRSDTGSPVDPEIPARNFEFINLSTASPDVKNAGQRKVVRAHVVRDTCRQRKLQRLQTEKLKGRRLEPSIPSSEPRPAADEPLHEYIHINRSTRRAAEILHRSNSYDFESDGSSDMAYSFGEAVSPPNREPDSNVDLTNGPPSISQWSEALQNQPNLPLPFIPITQHIKNMGVAMFPLSSLYKFNPVDPDGCLGWHPEEEVVYHGTLYVTSTYATLISGKPESKETMSHMGRVVTMVNSRLQEMGTAGNDPTHKGLVEAIACIALAEALKGNYNGWRMHMTGVKHLTDSTARTAQFSDALRHHLCRADLLGATTFLTRPFFTTGAILVNRASPDREDEISGGTPERIEAYTQVKALLYGLPIQQELITPLLLLSNLSNTISREVSSHTPCSKSRQTHILNQTYAIQYSLLDFLSRTQHTLSECLGIAGLLYMHATWQDFPFSYLGVTKLLHRLKVLVMEIEISGGDHEGLLIWLLFIGAISSEKGDSRIWFIANIQRLVYTTNFEGWTMVRSCLAQFWWVERIHGNLCRNVWDEVVTLDSVLVGY